MTQKPLGQVCNKLECPFFEIGYSKDCHEFDHAYKENGELDSSICLACPTVRAPQKVTKILTTGFPVCDICFDHYEPALKEADSKKDKVCPQCQKSFGLGHAGFCSETCFNARMDYFTKPTKLSMDYFNGKEIEKIIQVFDASKHCEHCQKLGSYVIQNDPIVGLCLEGLQTQYTNIEEVKS